MALFTQPPSEADISSAVATNKKNKTTTIVLVVVVVLACAVGFSIYKTKK